MSTVDELVDEFARGYAFGLDDFQREGCRRVAAGQGVLVAAPTGAGKTVVGEFGVFCALAQGTKCFYTTPIKALSNQKYHDLVARYGAERVGLLTGDTSINSEAQVVVMTTEVLRNMIYAGSPTLRSLGFVVMDEVHYLADRFRGAVWEEVIIGLAPSVQLIALSATVSNAEEFGEWLDEVRGGVDVVLSERRPVPLFQHVLVRRDLIDLFEGVAPTAQALLPGEQASHDVDVNPQLLRIAKEESRAVRDDSRAPRGRSGRGKRHQRGRVGTSAHGRFAERSRNVTSREDMVMALKQARLLPAICFVFSRAGCDAAVRQLLGSHLDLTSVEERAEIQAILDAHTLSLSPDDLRALDFDWFAEGMRRGIAAHHAGMLPAFKECVEAAFVRGLIKVVFATETLALGINMPAKSVVIEKLVKYNGETHADITPGEYTQLTGRAGRRGIDVEGHAIVLWQPGFDPRAVAGLASRRTYPLRSSFAPTYNMAVNMVGTVGRERARALLEQSFAQFQSDRSVVGTSRSIARNQEQIDQAWAAATCELGDFREYALLREEISRTEAEASRSRKADRRSEALSALSRLAPGDVIWVPAGKHTGWAVVIHPGSGADRDGPRPLVMTEAKQVKRLTVADFPVPVEAVSRVRVPKHFDAREASARRSLAAAMTSRLAQLACGDVSVPSGRENTPTDAAAMERVVELRQQMKAHPCHPCPDREVHARAAEKAVRLERENSILQQRSDARVHTIAKHFDRICLVLESLGYLTEGAEQVTETGQRLARIYSELDLVAAEALRHGVFDGLNGPQLAAVLSTIVYEARVDGMPMHRMPDRRSEQAQTELRRIWREVGLLERDHRLPRSRELDIGFAEAVYRWAHGCELAEVLQVSGLTAGDFVRWVRQVIDFCGQIADAAGPGPVRSTARAAVDAMRRGIIALAPEEE